MNKSIKFKELFKSIKNCAKCDLSKHRKMAVPGEGNLSAKVAFVGEAPGSKEDMTGRPFVGQAGKYLNQLLDEIKLPRVSIFITNIVKCRPPGNRNPSMVEIETCFPYLKAQLELIKPKIICTLGNFAFKVIIGADKSVSSVHGKFFKKGNLCFFSTYHPAAALYNPKLKAEIAKDFKKLGDAVETKICKS